MTAQDDLWAELHDLFDTDDGSLPEVAFTELPPTAVQPLFAFLRDRATLHPERGNSVYDPARDEEVPLHDVPDAGDLVVSGRLPGFHVLLYGIAIDGVTLPPLGVYVEDDAITLDYRMGDDWSPPVLAAFARLLGRLRELAGGGRLDPDLAPPIDRYLASLDR